MPRTFGENQSILVQSRGILRLITLYMRSDHPRITETDRRIGSFITEQIGDGATIQAGIGDIPNAVISLLGTHKNLGNTYRIDI